MKEASVERIADLVVAARHIVVLTGAGISTPSGIPDFRSPATGLWQQPDTEVVASLAGFRRDPQAFCSWLRPFVERVVQARPNPAHASLAALQRAGLVRTIITQNIDGLHQRAGARRVLELHGHLRRATCLQCRHRFPASGLLQAMLAAAAVPRCPRCGGLAKPDVTLFGEMLPAGVLRKAERDPGLGSRVGDRLVSHRGARLPAALAGARQRRPADRGQPHANSPRSPR